jgi:hypothetical protein
VNRRIVILCVGLIAAAAALAWLAVSHWKQARMQQAAALKRPVTAKASPPPSIPAPSAAALPSEYFDVAQRTLFSQDRNPTVVIEPPPVKPEPPLPPLPQYHGQMAIGEPVALLSMGSGQQKGYRIGEKVGDFKLVSFDREKIAFEWNDKTVERKISELTPKEPVAPTDAGKGASAGAQSAPAVPSPVANAGASIAGAATALGASGNSAASATAPARSPNPAIGDEIVNGVHSCVASDNSPAGTVLNGLKKVIYPSMFGPVCRWEPTK